MAWADLPLDLVGDVMAYLPLPADRARFAAVCGAWRSAARQLAASGRMPWILLPSGGVCTTIGHAAAFFRIPGLPEKTTCLGGATGADAWLVLDCTDDTCRRTPFWDNYCPDTGTFKDDPRPDVKHRHTYLLYNLFSNVTVPLPELDAIIGHVTETFEVCKVLMIMPPSSSWSTPDGNDVVIAVTTNHCEYNVILCRPGKGVFVLPYYKVIDIAFVRDILYGITMSEELLAFHLGEDEDGRPNITRFERAINSPLSYDHDESDEDDDDDEEEEEEEEEEDHNESDDDDHESDDNDNDNDNDDDDDDEEEEEGISSIDESDDDDEAAANQAWNDGRVRHDVFDYSSNDISVAMSTY
ncbi:testis-specific Y-encoded-like protein 2 [Sorghum bicolor]|uniref:testis-specific Y-encoded-like protein 2 n=1 Tax=Sorghum bicolor TaxID=4558 RepID=UPI000B42573D|nr:testis-specific Y-encoded-like protein 2 [Sorghum bicolor]|eukprot:XP_021320548.1 testis-specific Y-encoded-like protein 2 [Sorghum bicolor]